MRLFRKLYIKHTLLVYIVILFTAVAIFAPFIANEKPLIAERNNVISFPTLSNGLFQKDQVYDWKIMPVIPYSPSSLDYKNAQSIGPFNDQNVSNLRYRHWLGTDELGRDILSGVIHGARMAFLVGLGSMLIASIIGIVLGASAGFWGDHELHVRPFMFVTIPIGVLFGYFLGFHQSVLKTQFSIIQFLANQTFNLLILLAFIMAFSFIGHRLSILLMPNKKYPFPLDTIISRVIELAKSLPSLFIILSLAAILKPSIWNIIWIIGVIGWTGIARYCRAEVIRQKNIPSTESALALGYSKLYILLKHILPGALQASTVYIVFGIAAAILAESTLSFMGIGLQADEISWGSILAEARKSPTSWWLAIFPGLAIFFTLFIFNKLAVALERLDKNH